MMRSTSGGTRNPAGVFVGSVLVLALIVTLATLTSKSSHGPDAVAGSPDVLSGSSRHHVSENTPAGERPEYVADELLVRFKEDSSRAERRALREKYALDQIAQMPVSGLEHVALPPNSDEVRVAAALQDENDVQYAQTNNIYEFAATPDDPSYSSLWGMENTGQSVDGVSGSPDADVDAPEAWDVTTGNRDVRIAVVDTGVDYTHPDLAANIWVNPGESGENQANDIDDDGNGFVDDVHGWDFIDNDEFPMGENFHGTHVAGIVGAVGNNDQEVEGVVGINWETSIIPVRIGGSEGSLTDATIVPGLAYAGRHADVVNGSFGKPTYSPAQVDVINDNRQSLFVFAAGNDATTKQEFPCSYELPNVICVAATDQFDDLATFSNFGASNVDLAAPGVSILSTKLEDSYGFEEGTSMASPLVAGAAGLLLSFDAQLSAEDLKRVLLDSVDEIPALAGKTVTGGRLNVANALNNLRPPDGTASVSAGADQLKFLSGAAIENQTSISLSGGSFTVTDSAADLAAGENCVLVNSHTATCDSTGISSIEIATGDLDDDVIANTPIPATINAGSGHDVLTGGSGDDTFDGGADDDVFSGQAGSDTVDYSERYAPVQASLAGPEIGGEAGEIDDLGSSIENLRGGAASDTLVGDANANVLKGGPGDDLLEAGGGNDMLISGGGDDVVRGGDGVDTVSYADRTMGITAALGGTSGNGASGEDDFLDSDIENLTGGDGSDVLSGPAVANEFRGGDGDDLVDYAGRTADLDVSIDGVANDGATTEYDDLKPDIESIRGGSGDDDLTGSESDDTFDGGPGDDDFHGLGGIDTVTYATRTNPLDVTIDGQPGDGEFVEVDNIFEDVENLIGGSAGDELTGGESASRIDGGGGDDTIDGDAGDDNLIGGSGSDVMFGGSGNDTANYSAHLTAAEVETGGISPPGVSVSLDNNPNDGMIGSSEQDNVRDGIENITGSLGADTLSGDSSANRLVGLESPDALTGLDGDDILIAGTAEETRSVAFDWNAEVLTGGNGDDRLEGSAITIEFVAEPGSDTYVNELGGDATISYGSRSEPVRVSVDGLPNDGAEDENDNVQGTYITLTGGLGNDKLVAGPGAARLDGHAGDDTLNAWTGPIESHGATPSFYGGDGNDTVDYSDRSAGVNVTLDGGNSNGEVGEVAFVNSNVENVIGTEFADELTGNAQANVLDGMGDADVLVGLDGDDTLIGGPIEELTALTGSNSYDGGEGDDIIKAAGYLETLHAEPGADTYVGADTTSVDYSARSEAVEVSLDGAENDGAPGEHDNVSPQIRAVVGTEFEDRLIGSSMSESLYGRGGNDHLEGLAADDNLDGGDGADTLAGGDGDDTLSGGAYDEPTGFTGLNSYDGGEGDDVFRAAGSGETFYAEPGADTYLGAMGATIDYSSSLHGVRVSLDNLADDGRPGERDNVFSGVNSVIGTEHADVLLGNHKDNQLEGRGGDDEINGGQGDDGLIGGAGDDLMDGGGNSGDGDDLIDGGEGEDTVTYASRAQPVVINLSGAFFSNGEFGEGDYVFGNVENAIGGSGDDTLTGNNLVNVLTGGPGEDSYSGGGDDDVLMVNDGEDDPTIVCGSGTDSVVADLLPFDVVDPDCEGVTRT